MLIRGDARSLPLVDASVDCVVTSPPYFGLRDYGTVGQLGLEASPACYVAALVAVFREVRRVLKAEGTVWLNVGDSYNCSPRGNAPGAFSTSSLTNPQRQDRVARPHGVTSQRLTRSSISKQLGNNDVRDLKPKDLLMIPARVALALQADGWYLRSDIIWSKPNPMPESVTDRPTKAHEYLFLLTKSERYHYDAAAIAEPVSEAMRYETEQGYDGLGLKDYEAAGVQNPSTVKARIIANARRKNEQSGDRKKVGFNDRWDASLKATQRLDRDQIGAPSQMRALVSDEGDRYMSGRVRAKFNAEHGLPMTRNKRTVWEIPTMPYAGAHFATMPEALVEPCILAGCPLNGLVLDPFVGSGTVVAVAERLGRRGVGVDLSYQDLAAKRTAQRGIRFDVQPADAPAEARRG